MTDMTIDCNSPTLFADLLSQIENEMEPEQLLLFLYNAVDKLSLALGEKALRYKEELGKKFAPRVRELGMSLPVVNQLIKAQEVAAQLKPCVVEELDVPTLKKLAQPKNAKALEVIAQLEECSQEQAKEFIKEHRLPDEPKTPWKYVGAANTADGKPREYELPRVSETFGAMIEQKKQEENISARQVVEKALNQYFRLTLSEKVVLQSVGTNVLEGNDFAIAQRECAEYSEAQMEAIAPEIKEWDSFIYLGWEYDKYQQETVVVREILPNGRVRVGVLGRAFKFECSIADLKRCA